MLQVILALYFHVLTIVSFLKENQHLPLWLIVILIFMFTYHNPDFYQLLRGRGR